jgi:alpha-glucosidase (family GH31 glycosyl hydrolase)
VSFEVGSEFAPKVGFSVEGETLDCLSRRRADAEGFVRLTGRPALPPPWSFGLGRTTSFTTDCDEKTVTGFATACASAICPRRFFTASRDLRKRPLAFFSINQSPRALLDSKHSPSFAGLKVNLKIPPHNRPRRPKRQF